MAADITGTAAATATGATTAGSLTDAPGEGVLTAGSRRRSSSAEEIDGIATLGADTATTAAALVDLREVGEDAA